MDGPFGDQWILCVLQKIFRRKVDQQLRRCIDIISMHGLAQDCSISIANAREILQSCTKPSVCLVWILIRSFWPILDFMVSVYYWLPTQNWDGPSNMGGPLGDTGFCFFHSTAVGTDIFLKISLWRWIKMHPIQWESIQKVAVLKFACKVGGKIWNLDVGFQG